MSDLPAILLRSKTDGQESAALRLGDEQVVGRKGKKGGGFACHDVYREHKQPGSGFARGHTTLLSARVDSCYQVSAFAYETMVGGANWEGMASEPRSLVGCISKL